MNLYNAYFYSYAIINNSKNRILKIKVWILPEKSPKPLVICEFLTSFIIFSLSSSDFIHSNKNELIFFHTLGTLCSMVAKFPCFSGQSRFLNKNKSAVQNNAFRTPIYEFLFFLSSARILHLSSLSVWFLVGRTVYTF